MNAITRAYPKFIMASLVLVLFSINLKAQQGNSSKVRSPFDIRVDPLKSRMVAFEAGKTSSINEADDRILDSIFHLDKNYDFEFRLWSRYSSSNFNNVFVLSLRNNTWTARYFDLKNSMGDRRRFTERKITQSRVDQLWMRLVENKVLTLPDMADIRNTLFNYEIDTLTLQASRTRMEMTDGVLYSFELLNPTKKRHYSYANPQSLMKYHGNSEALCMASLNVLLIQKFLTQP
jgi:hypothetical protein